MRVYKVVFLFFFLFFLSFPALAAQDRETLIEPYSNVDSIMSHAIEKSKEYRRVINEYTAELYIKTTFDIESRNVLFRLIPMMFRPKKGVSHYIAESYSDLHYTAPNIYDQKVKAATGTIPRFGGPKGLTLEYFHINIYGSTLLYDKLVSPLASNARKYYAYRLDSVFNDANEMIHYKVYFKPKKSSFQLVHGYMIISASNWSVREFFFSGRSEFFIFNNRMEMGELGSETEFLPSCYNAHIYMSFLGNKVDGNYYAKLGYDSIDNTIKRIENKKYNLSQSYSFSTDTCSYSTNHKLFSEYRPIELTKKERQIYEEFVSDSMDVNKEKIKKNRAFWGDFGDLLLSSNTLRLEQYSSIKFSPLLNPFMLSYSGTNGLAYKQTIKYNHLFNGDKLLRVVPRLGYNFKQKELYWSINSSLEYWPQKRGNVHFDMGRGNPIYASAALKEFSETPDSVFDIRKFDLEYYRDLYFNLYHSLEVTNGLSIDVGMVRHRRKPVSRNKLKNIDSKEDESESDIEGKIKKTYISCGPRFSVSWTPGQYYYMNGKRKINLHGDYPTIIFEYERGIKGFMNSTGGYEKIELEVQQYIPLSLMKSVSYRIGGGKFTNQDQIFFVDFARFTKHNLPIGWKDEIGGVFQLLDSRWYNSSRHYIRGHLTYESPFLFLRHLSKQSRFVLNERLYLNVLGMNHLNPYYEIGYGIGTHIFDLGLFFGSSNWSDLKFGFEITFELFSR